ncbi:hypothetical protein D3C74_215750 [compost metagenome]
MKEIISKVFNESDFSIRSMRDSTIDHFFASSNNDRVSYFLVVFIKESQTELNIDTLNSNYDLIKKLETGYDNQMDKNLSMVICYKRDSLSIDENINRKIFQIEEDPYFFKKYVFTYTELQLQLVSHNLKGHKSYLEYLYGIINEPTYFHEHKEKPYTETEYNFVSKLFIKLPFLSLRGLNRDTIEDLPKTIQKKLVDLNLLNVREELLELSQSLKPLQNEKGKRKEEAKEEIKKLITSFIGGEDNEQI